ncbi:MAG TPA: hypothetical protein VHR45_00740 [Thermoanaerobaculia bacterium]|nr:hypothetical protein [Thermoanaerobaculia bacterium]
MAGRGTTVQLGPADVDFLAQRGGRSHRGPGDFSRSAILHRSLDHLRLLLAHHDPLKNGRLSPEQHELAIHVLPEPWKLRAFEIEHLEGVIERAPDFAAALAAKRMKPEKFLAAIGALTFGEKLALLDQAMQAQGPAAAAAAAKKP